MNVFFYLFAFFLVSQVNVFVNDCGADLLCTCAVSVRVGDDVIRVGNCEGSLSSRRPLLKQLFYAVPVNKDFRVVSENSGDSITVRVSGGSTYPATLEVWSVG